MSDIKKLLIRLMRLHLTIRIYPTDYCDLNISIRNDDYVINRHLTLNDIYDYGMEGILFIINDMIDKLEEVIDYERTRINKSIR